MTHIVITVKRFQRVHVQIINNHKQIIKHCKNTYAQNNEYIHMLLYTAFMHT